MPANRFNGFSDLGIGVGLRVPHYPHILENKPKIDWFEIISENYMVGGGRPLNVLEEILDSYPVVQHGVSLYFGSTDPYDPEHLKQLKKLTKRTKAPFVSDHLCWGSVDGNYTHDLLPIPYTSEAAKNTAKRVRQVQEFLEVPVCVENVSSYAEFNLSTMTEWEFLSEVAELADCGILLDVNNVFVSSVNHEFDPHEYLHNIPHNRVGQIHIAGHTRYETHLLDTHDAPVCDDVWKLYAALVKLIGPTNTLLEWDAHIPSFEEVHREALKARKFIDKAVDEYRKATA
jgi:uncharacterized protein